MTNRFFAGQTNFIEELNALDGESGDAQQAIDDHIADTTVAHAASAISNTPAGNIAATTVQAAINELDAAQANLAGAVRYDIAQTLTSPQQVQARANIGFDAAVRDTTLTGIDTGTNGTVTSADSVLTALGKTYAKIVAYITAVAASSGSALVGWIQAGVGAVAATVQSKLRQTISVLDFGAVGDGVTDDSTAFNNAATAAAGKRLVIPAGTYLVKNFTLTSNTEVRADRNAVLKLSDGDVNASIVRLNGDNIKWAGGKLLGDISAVYGTVPAPYYCMQLYQSAGDAHPLNCLVSDLEIVGGKEGLFAFSSDGLTIENLVCRSQYEWGCAMPAPRTKQLMIRGLRAYACGLEGLKIASVHAQTGDASADIIIDDIHVEGCGMVESSAANWQEGIDLFLSAGQRLQITNFNIIGCGNGGIEVKRSDAPSVSPNELKNIIIANGHITVSYDDAIGIALNWTTTFSGTPDTAKQVSIHGVQIDYAGPATPTSAYSLAIHAFTDVEISDCQMYGAFKYNCSISPTGSSDATARRITFRDCTGIGASTAVVALSNNIEDIKFIDCNFMTTGDTIAIGSGVASGSGFEISGGSYESTGSRWPVSIQAAVTDILIRDAWLKSDDYAAVLGSGTGRLVNCHLISTAQHAVSVGGGTWELFGNTVTVPTAKRTWVTSGGTVKPWRNSRGSDSATPTLAGSLGDVVENNAPSAASGTGWFVTAAGNPATWTLLGGTSIFAAPPAIGGTTPAAAAFTTVSATGQITSTVSTGTAPLVVASTTVVANLNAALLNGATFAAPGAIGGGTPGTAVFTTLTATGQASFADGTVAAPSVRVGDEQNGIYSDGAGSMSFATDGKRVVRMGTVGATGNYLRFDANNTPMVTAVAGGTNADLGLASAGTGSVLIATGGSINNIQARFLNTTGATASVTITGSNGSNPTIGTTAGDLAISTNLTVSGLVTATTLRVNVTPTAETPSATHTATFSISGTNYKFLCLPA